MVFFSDFDDSWPPLDAHGGSGRIVEVGHSIKELDRPALAALLQNGLLQSFGDQPVAVHGHIDHIDLEGLEDAQSTHIVGCLSQHYIAWVAHNSGDQVQSRLGTVDYDHIIRLDVLDAFQLHNGQYIFAQMGIALG